ncbi:MAG: response regulator [Dehalococcoidia bacterium]
MPIADRMLVLLIEDDIAVQRVTTRILESFGYEVASAEDIAGAVDLVNSRGTETACVLVDYSLRAGTGVDAIKRMRELDGEVPVIMLSGYPQVEIESNAGDAMWTGFLQKPYTAGDLRAIIEQYRRA